MMLKELSPLVAVLMTHVIRKVLACKSRNEKNEYYIELPSACQYSLCCCKWVLETSKDPVVFDRALPVTHQKALSTATSSGLFVCRSRVSVQYMSSYLTKSLARFCTKSSKVDCCLIVALKHNEKTKSKRKIH